MKFGRPRRLDERRHVGFDWIKKGNGCRMRAFLSIPLTDELHQSIETLQRRLDEDARGVRWTRAQNCHLTLKFFGDVSPSVAEKIVEALAVVGPQFDPFSIQLKGIGQFPPRGPLSVLWVGVQAGEAPLRALEQSIHEALQSAEISFDRKSFSPHLTIGRARRGDNSFLRNSSEHKQLDLGSLRVGEFCLMESVLQPGGPIYTVKRRFALGSPDDLKM
ncbi:MAG: RNA 2',3'-cyclic phosphodiesterase [Candidatus Omnitrophica bacterium]|nr:RNA 2',3'-cyclic phosphodiesterase [Candidatus Omnitrophota bacterium]